MKKTHIMLLLGMALAAAMLAAAPLALAQSAVVDNGSDLTSRLNLRAQPSKDAASLGKFYSGTAVDVVADAGD
ncbi:MAG: SH3 domain-containing protein, partial [Clostridiales bacterium]|nr:SH3 domain-containing protein [Clostridiales bacterium]